MQPGKIPKPQEVGERQRQTKQKPACKEPNYKTKSDNYKEIHVLHAQRTIDNDNDNKGVRNAMMWAGIKKRKGSKKCIKEVSHSFNVNIIPPCDVLRTQI